MSFSKGENISILSGILNTSIPQVDRDRNMTIFFQSRVKDALERELFDLVGRIRKGEGEGGNIVLSESGQEIAESARDNHIGSKEYKKILDDIDERLREKILLGELTSPDVRECPPAKNKCAKKRTTMDGGLKLAITGFKGEQLRLHPGKNLILGGGADCYKTPTMASILQLSQIRMDSINIPVLWITTRSDQKDVYTQFYAMETNRVVARSEQPELRYMMAELPYLEVYGRSHFLSEKEENSLPIYIETWLENHKYSNHVIVALDGIDEIAHFFNPFSGRREEEIRGFIAYLDRLMMPYKHNASVVATYRFTDRILQTLERRVDNYELKMKMLGFSLIDLSTLLFNKAEAVEEDDSEVKAKIKEGLKEYSEQLYSDVMEAMLEKDRYAAPHGQYGVDAFNYPLELGFFFDICLGMWTNTFLKERNQVLIKVIKHSYGVTTDIPYVLKLFRKGNGTTEFTQYVIDPILMTMAPSINTMLSLD